MKITREQVVQRINKILKCYKYASNLTCASVPCDKCDFYVPNEELVEAFEIAVRELKTAKWLKEDRGGIEYTAVCSECGYDTYWSDIEYYNYCPGCGRKMETEE